MFLQTIPRKAVSKSVIKAKGKLPGNKTEKKASKAKAGYELYSDRDDPENGHRYPGYRGQDFIRTLIEDYQSREASLLHNSLTESASDADISYTVEKHLRWTMDQKTPFNKRLCSSTPVPDTFNDSESLLPQSQQNEMGVDMVAEPDQLDCKKEEGSVMLSEAQREKVRQQLDAALVEEARAQNNQSQEQAANLLNAQVLAQKTVPGNSSVQSRNSASVTSPRHPTPLTRSGDSDSLSQFSHGQKVDLRLRKVTASALNQQQETLPKDMRSGEITSASWAYQSQGWFRRQEIPCRPSDHERIPPSPAKHAEMRPVSQSRSQIPSSGMASKFLQSTYPGENQKSQQPCNQIQNRTRHDILTSMWNIPASQVAESHQGPLQSSAGPQTRLGQASSSLPNSDRNKQTGVNSLTSHGGQDMNQSAEEHDSVPRIQQPVPSAMPGTQHSDGAKRNQSAVSFQFNRNNSNFYGTSQLNISQNTSSDSTEPKCRQAQNCGRSTPVQGEAAAADTGRSGWKDSPPSSEAQVTDITWNDVNDRCFEFQEAFTQLKKYTDQQGDSTLCVYFQRLHAPALGLQQMVTDIMMEKRVQVQLVSYLKREVYQLNKMVQKMEKNRRRELPPSGSVDLFNLLNKNLLLETELAKLKDQVANEEQRHKEQCESLVRQNHQLRLQLKEKENENRVCHHEKEMNASNLQSEMYLKSLRIKSIEGEVAKANQEISSLKNLNQLKDFQIKNLQDSLGSMKQAATEVMHHLKHGTDVKHLLALHCSRILQELVQSSSFSRPDQSMVSPREIHLDVSGNQRTSRSIVSGRSGNENLHPTTLSSDRKAIEASQQPLTTKETVSMPTTKSELFPKDITNVKEPALVKESRSTKSEPSPRLTVEAVAAHNQKLGTAQKEEPKSSGHSWDETKLTNQPKPCSSEAVDRDDGSTAQKYDNIQQWSSGIKSERQKVANPSEDVFHDQNTAQGSELRHDNKADAVSETESVTPLSERSISQGKTGSILETQSWHSISEVPISEVDCSEPVKETHFSAAFSKASLGVSEIGRKNLSKRPATVTSATTVYTSSPPASPRKRNLQMAWPADPREDKKRSPSAASVSSTLTVTASSVTQRDFFQGSMLDLSVSTIQEEVQSTLTGASVSTLKSMDQDQFAEKLKKLTGDIDKAKEDLQQLKNK